MKAVAAAVILLSVNSVVSAETGVLIPQSNTFLFDSRPFFIVWSNTMRYQQVFSSTAFTNVPPSDVYLSVLTIFADSQNIGRTQISLSTTEKAVDGLSTNFAENVGADETIVFGPTEGSIPTYFNGHLDLAFQRPFIYNPTLGNLLIDIRVSIGITSPLMWPYFYPRLEGQVVSNDLMSRVWADDVNAATATAWDSGGFTSVLSFYSAPSLRCYESSFGTATNYIVLEWYPYPTFFQLQRSSQLGPGASWTTVATNNGIGGAQRYFFPVSSAPPVGYYRLFWRGP